MTLYGTILLQDVSVFTSNISNIYNFHGHIYDVIDIIFIRTINNIKF
jgi:hypothetical protein